ncbi:MGDG synthase family glycosyltransferase [Tepidibacillus sp. LV47]|uniref:MGDG synthase family glycosyltransferase n=1 Tax=Tepidibacillus sp. LV47 TaxID=3398228 RepID=UPI003AACCF93
MKILIMTEEFAGNGHHKAAESLLKTMKKIDPRHEVKIVHLLKIINQTLEQWIQKIYLFIILKKPRIWGWIYKKEGNFSLLFKPFIAYAMLGKLDRFLKEENPDLIIATHASGLTALAKLKKRNHYKLAAVFTDYHLNSFWIHPEIDYYFVGHEELKNRLVKKYQMEPERVIISGIPIDPSFSCLKQDPLTQENANFRILVMGGGLGIGSMKEIVQSLQKIKNVPFSVYVITGRNQKLYDELTQLASSINYSLEVLPYIEDICPIMMKSHLIITKPGGLTISEALSTSTPIFIYQPIPGQEEYNARFLIKNRSAIRIHNLDHIVYWVEYLYHHPRIYQKFIQHQKKIAKPDSSYVIIENLLNRL